MKLLAGFLAAALAQDEDRWGYYDYYGNSNVGKSQNSQSHGVGPLAIGRSEGIMGNGRICWECSERNYGHCLGGTAMVGDATRHGATYCTGEDYFCYANERRIIRHDGNDFNFEFGGPWTAQAASTYQEESVAFGSSNMNQNTNIKVEMGCQQPMACLRQQNKNYQIDMGQLFFGSAGPIAKGPAGAFAGNVREGMCRLGLNWVNYSNGNHASDNYRENNWRPGVANNDDRRYGAPDHHYHFGRGTESVCHFCCDPLLEMADGDTNPLTPGDYFGCNFNHFATNADISATNTVDENGNLAGNRYTLRHTIWDKKTWYNNMQYHGMFRNPHSQYAHKTMVHNLGGPDPNTTG